VSVRIAKRWFRIVSADTDKVIDALEWYMNELDEGHRATDITGNLMRANQNQSGFVAYYDSMHTDLDAILELFERLVRLKKGEVLRRFADNPPTNVKLGVTEIKVLADSDPEVAALEEITHEIRYVYKQYGSLLKALSARGYTLTNISKLRVAGLEEVQV
jgi:hypothetical protein